MSDQTVCYALSLKHLYPLRNQEARGKIDMSGLEAAPTNYVVVTFHVLLPYQMWGWSEQTKLVITFGEQNLGNWKIGFGDFTKRYAFVMKCMR